jgi:DNA-3-methyladenine glycosylase
MSRVLEAKELVTQNTVALARQMLGRVLVRTHRGVRREHLITEVEAYDGEKDLACHASKGRTARTEVMYRPGGVWYVYLCYGVHEMLNLVTGPQGYPAAILFRGVDGMTGPGRLTRRLHIGRALNGAPARPESGLHVEDHGIFIPRGAIRSGPRVGVHYAGPRWSGKPWRFWLDPRWLERPRPG